MRKLLPSLALAALAARALAGETPCLADAERLCPGIPAGDGRLWACLLRNDFRLSSACVENVRLVQRRATEFSSKCAADVWRYCPAVPAGAGRVLDCLAVHVGRRELSTPCEEAVVVAVEKLQEFAVACAADAEALCPGVQAGGGRLLACLRAGSERLSSRCRAIVRP